MKKIRIEHTPEYYELILGEGGIENLKNMYLVQRIDKESIAKYYDVHVELINRIIKHYGLKKESKYKSFQYLIDNLDKEEFLNFYKKHNIFDTAKYYETSVENISKYCKHIGYVKDKFVEDQEKVSREDLYQYYIVENHSYYEAAKHFGISTWSLDKLKRLYGIEKYNVL